MLLLDLLYEYCRLFTVRDFLWALGRLASRFGRSSRFNRYLWGLFVIPNQLLRIFNLNRNVFNDFVLLRLVSELLNLEGSFVFFAHFGSWNARVHISHTLSKGLLLFSLHQAYAQTTVYL